MVVVASRSFRRYCLGFLSPWLAYGTNLQMSRHVQIIVHLTLKTVIAMIRTQVLIRQLHWCLRQRRPQGLRSVFLSAHFWINLGGVLPCYPVSLCDSRKRMRREEGFWNAEEGTAQVDNDPSILLVSRQWQELCWGQGKGWGRGVREGERESLRIRAPPSGKWTLFHHREIPSINS